MDVPTTVTAALDDQSVEGAVCLEAGAGVGNMTAGLLAAGAKRVYAITNDSDHARHVYERIGLDDRDRLVVLKGDLRETPLATDSVDLVTAHGLCNVLSPAALDAVVTELTRVAGPDARLVVDDYAPLPDDAPVRELFALENAAAELATGEPALTFYPAGFLRRVFEGDGWTFDRELTLLEPVPWTESHLSAHLSVVREHADALPSAVASPLCSRAEQLEATLGTVDIGRMYSLTFRLSD